MKPTLSRRAKAGQTSSPFSAMSDVKEASVCYHPDSQAATEWRLILMETYYEDHAYELMEQAKRIAAQMVGNDPANTNPRQIFPESFEQEFYRLVDRVNLGLMEDAENFYGYFLFQLSREIRFDFSSPTAVNFQGARYVIYFNPLLFLKLSLKQMESCIKHEILHILSLHLLRAKEFRNSYSKLAVNMAMDIIVNKYLTHLPPYATTLEWVNQHYSLALLPYQPFEYYVEKLQSAIALAGEEKHALSDASEDREAIASEYDPELTHELWEESEELSETVLQEFTDKAVSQSEKGSIPAYVAGIIDSLRNSRGELPWNLYLNRLMGTVEGSKKKIITRRSRRQPDRLELRGELRSHKAKIVVAFDISGSISDEEFTQAIKEVLSIVKNYHHEITIIECDSEIKNEYKVKSIRDIKDRSHTSGGTRFNPVFEYANHHNANLLVYFTDGKGEDHLKTIPRGYPVLWVISGRGEELSLKKSYGVVKKLSQVEVKEEFIEISDVVTSGFSMNNQERIL